MKIFFFTALLALGCGVSSLARAEADSTNVVVNGDFEALVPAEGGVPNWTMLGDNTKIQVKREGTNQFVRLQLPKQDYLQVTQQCPVGKDWKGIEVSGKMRVEGLAKGPEGHNTATLLYTFNDATGKHLGPWTQSMVNADQDWTPFHAVVRDIPEGAAMLVVACGIMNASGTADFDDIVIQPVTAAQTADTGKNPAADPKPREEGWCLGHHQNLTRKAKSGGFDVMLIGDSITWEWEANKDTGAKVWNELAAFKPATFAVSGDRTEHVLWRLQNGNLEAPVPPKAAVLLIGINNTARSDTPEQIADGTKAIVEEIHKKFPQTKVLLYGMFPKGETLDDQNRKTVDGVNQITEKMADGKTVFFVNINADFLNGDGTMNHKFFRDGLHLTEEGYRVWAASLKKELAKLL